MSGFKVVGLGFLDPSWTLVKLKTSSKVEICDQEVGVKFEVLGKD